MAPISFTEARGRPMPNIRDILLEAMERFLSEKIEIKDAESLLSLSDSVDLVGWDENKQNKFIDLREQLALAVMVYYTQRKR